LSPEDRAASQPPPSPVSAREQPIETLQLGNLRDRGLTILLVEQNVVQSLEIADRGYVLANGRVELQGSAADLRASPKIQDAYLGV